MTLDEELLVLTRHVLRALREADREGQLLDVRNPAHQCDRFTDRWPSSLGAQRLWIEDLEYLERELAALRNGPLHPNRLRVVMVDLFGESVADDAVKGLMTRHKIGFDRGETGLDSRGRIAKVTAASAITAASGAAANSASRIKAPPPKTFFGGILDE